MSIVLSELTKWFHHNLVVNNVSLEVQDGELFVLLGSSGSGKSTVLRLIAGLLEPSAGRIELRGRDVTRLPTQQRGVGFVFQNYSVFRHMTVAQNIEFGLRIRRAPAAERRQRVEELLDLVGLAGLGGRYADQLSGGQQQRVALARALAYTPSVLLLDEPFGALDVQIRSQLRLSLKDIQRQLGVTTILVTHDQEEAFELADRIGVMERGHLLEVGRPQDLYHRPRSEYVATFVGGGNVLVGREEQGHIRLGTTRLPLPPGAPAHDPGARVRILFRPETVVMQETPFTPDQNLHVLGQGQVARQVFSGDTQRIVLEVENLEGVRPLAPVQVYGQRTTRIEALLPSVGASLTDERLSPGRRLWLGLPGYHVLDPAGLKVLISAGTPGEEEAARLGCLIARTMQGSATLVSVAGSPDQAPARRLELEALRQRFQADLPRLEIRLRQGETGEELVREVKEGHYELVVLGCRQSTASLALGPGSLGREVLTGREAAVLLVPGEPPITRIERLLICTATGEPGKNDVLFGGRLARWANAHVTVLHVLAPGAAPHEQRRVQLHLAQASNSLYGLGVQNDVKIASGPVLESVLEAARTTSADLVVIGAPNLEATAPRGRTNLAAQIFEGAGRPVMIVPVFA